MTSGTTGVCTVNNTSTRLDGLGAVTGKPVTGGREADCQLAIPCPGGNLGLVANRHVETTGCDVLAGRASDTNVAVSCGITTECIPTDCNVEVTVSVGT